MPIQSLVWRTLFALMLALPALPLAALELPSSETLTLENGLQIILTPRPGVPMIDAQVAIRGGALADPEGREGTASLLAELLGKGAGQREAKDFVDAVADVGGELGFHAEREALWAQADFLAEDSPLMLELIADALQRPRLDKAEFEKSRQRAIQSLAAEKDSDPRGLLATYGQAWLFAGHPYGRPVGGDENSLAAISHEDLVRFHRDHVGADRTILSITGAFDPDRMKKAVRHAFSGWNKAAAPLPTVSSPKQQKGPRVLLVDKPGATQSYFWIGNVGAAINDPDAPAQELVQTLFGGRFTSMLNTELRVKSGLTYGARASLSRLAQPGAAAYSSFTRTDATVQAIDMALAVQDRLHQQPIEAEQLDSARQYVLGQFSPNYQTNGQIAGALAQLALYGLPRETIEQHDQRALAVTPEAVSRARSVFPSERDYAMVIIGDANQIAEHIGHYGPVTRMRIDAAGFAPGTP